MLTLLSSLHVSVILASGARGGSTPTASFQPNVSGIDSSVIFHLYSPMRRRARLANRELKNMQGLGLQVLGVEPFYQMKKTTLNYSETSVKFLSDVG